MSSPRIPPPAVGTINRLNPWLLILFVGSGCSALIYEIVWFQMLQLVVGSTAVSLGVLLGTFMGGMCLGSLLLPRYVSPARHPLRVYAALELGIGAWGLLILVWLPYGDNLYALIGGQGTWGLIARAVMCVVCLLIPTVLMGATLPAVARRVETTPTGVSWLGFFYGGNIAGAVIGCLVAGFYLLRVYDMMFATFVAAGINAAVAILAFGLSKIAPHQAPVWAKTTVLAGDSPSPWPVYVAIALSGAGALGAEVVWTRLLSLLLGGTVYTFSIILAVFLIGLGLGSTLGAALARRVPNPRVALGVVQTLLAGAVLWAAYQIVAGIPNWPINLNYAYALGPWVYFQIDFVRSLWCVLPAAVLWGASFPLALAGVAGPGQDPGKLVGRVYAANTVGAILGAVLFSVFLVDIFPESADPAVTTRSESAQIALIALAATAAVVALLLPIRTLFSNGAADTSIAMGNFRLALMPAAVVAAVIAARYVPPTPWQLIAYGRDYYWQVAEKNDTKSEALFVGEGMNSAVAVIKDGLGDRNFYVSGKIEASSTPQDMKLQRMLAHIPALVHPNPKTVLVVGCGAGVTAGSFLVHPSVERVVICEIEPLIPKKVAPHFKNENYGVTLNHPKVEIVYDDARHFMLTATETFDVITSDPIHPWVKGAATLYTKEYFELVKKRLNPGGMVTQWVPLYQSSPDVVKSEVATFFAAFPDGSVWGNPKLEYLGVEPMGYDTVLLGHVDPLKVDMVALGARIEREDHLPVVKSLGEVEFFNLEMLFSRYTCRAADLKGWLENAEINRDRNLRLQYLAGLSAAFKLEGSIYSEMLGSRTYPEDMFLAPVERQNLLKQWLGFLPKNQ
jgi:spermidine synthase